MWWRMMMMMMMMMMNDLQNVLLVLESRDLGLIRIYCCLLYFVALILLDGAVFLVLLLLELDVYALD